MNWILVVLLSIIILEAVYEGLAHRGKKFISGLIEGLSHAVVLFGIVGLSASPIWYLIYLLYRYVIFDLVYNPVAGNKVDYVGNTKLYDKVLNWVLDKLESIKVGKAGMTPFPRMPVLFITKILAAWAAIGLTIRHF